MKRLWIQIRRLKMGISQGKICGRFCKNCDEWFTPDFKNQHHCRKCKTTNRRKTPTKDRLNMSQTLRDFYVEYGIIK